MLNADETSKISENNLKKIIYRFENVSKAFDINDSNQGQLTIFKDLNFSIKAGETVGIIGASGSGKSTLLHIMGTLDKQSSGKIFFEEQEMEKFSPIQQAHFRNRCLGFVFQFHHLLPEFTLVENVAMPGLICRENPEKIYGTANKLLDRVGLTARKNYKPATLSGGERQRAAIARALIMSPKVVLADEPTGNLDEYSGNEVKNLLLELNQELGMTLVIVTHNQDIAANLDTVFELRGGALYEKK